MARKSCALWPPQSSQAGTMVATAWRNVPPLESGALFGRGNQAFSAQRPALGEKRLFQGSGSPAKQQVRDARFSVALPSRDLVPAKLSQARASYTIRENCCLRRPYFSQVGTMVAAGWQVVPAWERNAPFSERTGCFLHNVPALERSAPFRSLAARQNRRSEVRASRPLSQAGTLFQPNSPKRGRCARKGRIAASDGRISPKPGPCSSWTLPSKDVAHDLGRFDPRPLQSSQTGTLCRPSSPKPGRCASSGRSSASGADDSRTTPFPHNALPAQRPSRTTPARPRKTLLPHNAPPAQCPLPDNVRSPLPRNVPSAQRPLAPAQCPLAPQLPGAPWFLCTGRRRCVWVRGILVK